MFVNSNKKQKHNFVKAKTAESRKKQKAAIVAYYLNKQRDNK